RSARLAEQEDRDVGVAPPRLDDELAQVGDRPALGAVLADLLVVDRHDERRRPRRLVGDHRHVDVGEAADHLPVLVLDRLGQRADAQAAGGIGLPVLVDDDDREAELHVRARRLRSRGERAGRRRKRCKCSTNPRGGRRVARHAGAARCARPTDQGRRIVGPWRASVASAVSSDIGSTTLGCSRRIGSARWSSAIPSIGRTAAPRWYDCLCEHAEPPMTGSDGDPAKSDAAPRAAWTGTRAYAAGGPRPRRPRVAVYGAGAVGCFFGAKLAEAGAPVTLIGRAAHVDAIRRDGLLFESPGATRRVRIAADTGPGSVRDADLVLFCVKTRDTDDGARALAPLLRANAIVASLQNGVDNVPRLREAGVDALAAVVYVATSMPAPGHLLHAG